MLAGAQAKNLFVELLEGDLPALLANETRDWPLIVAGDALTYFGGLRDILRGVAARLSAKGHFIFSAIALCPSADGTVPHNEGWLQVLGGRHVHSQAYVTQALQDAGFVVRSMELETLRYEARTPVAGWIIVAVHTTDSGVGVECGL
jgi:predicted TPR repeat methyltransferase